MKIFRTGFTRTTDPEELYTIANDGNRIIYYSNKKFHYEKTKGLVVNTLDNPRKVFLIKYLWLRYITRKLDLVHIDFISRSYNWYRKLSRKIDRVPYIFDIVEIDSKDSLNQCKSIPCDLFVVHSDPDRKLLIKAGVDRARIYYKEPGYLDSVFKPFSGKQIGLSYQIIAVGDLDSDNNPELLIEAFKYLSKEYSLRWVSVDSTHDRELEMKELAENLNVENKVLFGNSITNEELLDLYNKSELFVLPSKKGRFDKHILEALACGLPVLSEDGLINISGYIGIDSYGPKNLAKQIEKLVREKPFVNSKKTSEAYNISRKSKEMVEVYQKLYRHNKA